MTNYSCTTHNIHNDVDVTADGILRLAYQIVAPTIVIVGILGNVLNLIVLRKPFLKTCTRLFLIALASSDLSVMITVIPMVFRLNKYHGNSFQVAFFYAHIELFLTNVFITASVLIVVCLTIERYFSVCYPTTFKNIHTKRYAKIGIFWCYVFAILVSFPLTIFKKVCMFDEHEDKCAQWEFEENTYITDSIYWTIYLWFSEIVIRLGPGVTLAILNILIIRKLRKIRSKRQNFLTSLTQSNFSVDVQNVNKSIKNLKYKLEKKIGALLRAIVILFFITMTPSSILSLVYSEIYEPTFGFQIFRAFANNLELANFALNFYVYFLCSKDFRLALCNVFNKCVPSNGNDKSENEVNNRNTI